MPEFLNLRNLTFAVLACTVILSSVVSSRPHPDDSFFVFSNDGKELCVLHLASSDVPISECGTKRSTSTSNCPTSPCGGSPCAEPVPSCPKSRTCCMRVQLNCQPFLINAFATVEDTQHLLGMMLPCDEKTDYQNIKPPVPPPKHC